MSGGETSTHDAALSKKIKLVVKTSPGATPIDIIPPSQRQSKDGSSSPPRPSFSPVTPTGSHEAKKLYEQQAPKWMDQEPPAPPVSLDENPDVIALRATISLLQMQRQQSLKDIRDLDRIRDLALDDPEAFVAELKSGKLSKPATAAAILFDDVEDTDEVEDDKERDDEGPSPAAVDRSRYGRLPNPQNVVRCPPIEWSKYHILGQPLDELHEKQRRYPGVGEKDFARSSRGHEIAAPYRPFTDKLAPDRRPHG